VPKIKMSVKKLLNKKNVIEKLIFKDLKLGIRLSVESTVENLAFE
jgi:hypothetical protein